MVIYNIIIIVYLSLSIYIYTYMYVCIYIYINLGEAGHRGRLHADPRGRLADEGDVAAAGHT